MTQVEGIESIPAGFRQRRQLLQSGLGGEVEGRELHEKKAETQQEYKLHPTSLHDLRSLLLGYCIKSEIKNLFRV